jgi:hypothetical protein
MAAAVQITVNQANRRDMAEALLAAAKLLGLSPGVVRSTTDGYLVPPEVAKTANVVTDLLDLPVESGTPTVDGEPVKRSTTYIDPPRKVSGARRRT